MPISALVLILANALPLVGVIFWGWDAVLVLAVFWIENLIIGFFNILKMFTSSVVQRELSGVFLIGFFLIHYGAFCSIHGLLLTDLLEFQVNAPAYLAGLSLGPAELFVKAAVILDSFITQLAPQIWLGVTALFLSQLVSFIENFILNGSLYKIRAKDLMAKPYAQIVIMHVGLLLGAYLLQFFGSPVWLLVLIVLLKVVVDFVQFRRRHLGAVGKAQQVKDF